MQAALAPRGDSHPYLTHFLGSGLEDERYVVQRYRLPAAVICENFEYFGGRPNPGEPDPRAVRDESETLAGVDTFLDAFVDEVAPDGTQLANESESLLWDFFNTLHMHRHTAVNQALMPGENLPLIGKLLVHRRYRTTARYAHLADWHLGGRQGRRLTRPAARRSRRDA